MNALIVNPIMHSKFWMNLVILENSAEIDWLISLSRITIHHGNHNNRWFCYSNIWCCLGTTAAAAATTTATRDHWATRPAHVSHPVHPQSAQQSELLDRFCRGARSNKIPTKFPDESVSKLYISSSVRRWPTVPRVKKSSRSS